MLVEKQSRMHPAPIPGRMTQVVRDAYGSPDVLRLEETERPSFEANEVLVEVKAASVCRGDVFLLTGTPYLLRLAYGLRRPKQRPVGQDFSGRVVAVGHEVSTLQPGDEVYGQVENGAFAEYIAVPAERLAAKPTNLSFEEAAAVPDSAMTALQGLRNVANVQPGQTVLINGASGGVGSFAVQIARALGAKVTAVCSTRHVEQVRALGAERVIDYRREDFITDGGTYDVMFDLVGNRSLSNCRRILAPGGTFVACAGAPDSKWIGPMLWLLRVLLMGMFVSQKMATFVLQPNSADLIVLKELIESGQVTPLVEHRFPMASVAAAMAHVAEGHAQGKTVIQV